MTEQEIAAPTAGSGWRLLLARVVFGLSVAAVLVAIWIEVLVARRMDGVAGRFVEDLGFIIAWSDADLAYLRCDDLVSCFKISTIQSMRATS